MLRDHVRSEAQDTVQSIAREVVSGGVERVFDIVCNVQEFLRRPRKNEEQYTHKTHPVRSLSSLSGLQQSAGLADPSIVSLVVSRITLV